MESSLPANNLVALKFLAEFSDSQYELFEVDNERSLTDGLGKAKN